MKKEKVPKRNLPLDIIQVYDFFNAIQTIVFGNRNIQRSEQDWLEKIIAKEAKKCKLWVERFVRQENDRLFRQLVILGPEHVESSDDLETFGPPHGKEAEARIKRMLKRRRREMRMRQYKARRKA